MSLITVDVDLRPLFGLVRDQRQRPTCLAFAASDAHAAIRAAWAPLSCEFAFYHAQRRAGRAPSEGSLLQSMLEALHKDGQPLEGGWPYLPDTPVDRSSWVPPLMVGPRFGRDGIIISPLVDQVVAELDRRQPVIILTTLSRSFYLPNAQAVIDPVSGEAPETQRRHAVVAVGYGKVGGCRAVLIRNSWGPRWGESGHGWLTERFLTPRMFALAKLTEASNVPADTTTA